MRVLVCAILILSAGCAQQREQQTEQKRNLRRETVEVRQVALPDGKLVQLTTKTVTTERETSAELSSELIQVEAPKVLSDLGAVAQGAVKAVATATMGPAGGQAVDWIWQTVAGVAAAGAAAATGKAAVDKRKAQEQVRAKVRAMDAYAADVEQAETDEEVAALKQKHRERQKALGIHESLEQDRHA